MHRRFISGPNSNKRACAKCFVRGLLERNRLLIDEANTECFDDYLEFCSRIKCQDFCCTRIKRAVEGV